MATITTTTNTGPFVYPSHQHLVRLGEPYNHLFVLVKSSTANVYEIWRSTDAGSSWALFASFTRASVIEVSSLMLAIDGYIHIAYRTNESSQDRIYWRRLKLQTAVWSSEVLVASPANGGVAGAVHTGLDVHAAVYGVTTTYVVVAVGYQSGASQGLICYGVVADNNPGGGAVASNNFLTGSRQWLSTGTGRLTPSVDFEHRGDSLNAESMGHMWIAYGRTSARLVKLTFNAGTFNGPTVPVILNSSITAQDFLTGRYDGDRFITLVPSADQVVCYERNKANTATTVRSTPVHPTGNIRSCTLAYNSGQTIGVRDFRVYATGTSTAVLYYVDYIRATGVWTSWSTVTADTVQGTPPINHGVRKTSYGNAKYDVYHSQNGAPNTLKHTAQALVYSPFAPTWAAPTTGTAQDVAATLTLDWVFSDPDPADTQSAYALSRQIGAGALAYFRASDSTWQATEQKNTGVSTTERVLATSWGADADANHTYKVKVWDSSDAASVYSEGLVVIPSAKVNPTLTWPTSGGVNTTDTLTMTWTVAQQTAYKVRLLIFGTELYNSGWVSGSTLTHVVPYKLTDGFSYTAELTTKNTEGLASNVVSNSFSVDFIEPAIPTLVCTAVPASGYITVAITNPTPSGGQPAVASQELWRRPHSVTGQDVRVATGLASGASYNDWRCTSGVSYEYRSIVSGVNGTSASSAWTA